LVVIFGSHFEYRGGEKIHFKIVPGNEILGCKTFLQKYFTTFATSRMYEIMETTIYNRNGIIRYSKSIHATTTTT
jgi:hypothetical protein